jgi:hypothetical protein
MFTIHLRFNKSKQNEWKTDRRAELNLQINFWLKWNNLAYYIHQFYRKKNLLEHSYDDAEMEEKSNKVHPKKVMDTIEIER